VPTGLSLADLEQMALANNPTLAAASARIGAARGDFVQAGLYPNPTAGYYAMDMGEDGTAGQQGAFAGQQFITGGKLALARAEASWEVERSRHLLNAQELRVLTDVRMRFYDTLVAQRQVDLTSQLADVSNRFSQLSAQLLENQQLSQSDLLQAEVETQEARILFDNARNQHTEAWRRLAAVVGISPPSGERLAGQLEYGIPPYDWESVYSCLLAQSPELQAARARVEKSRVAIARARQQVVPDVDVMVNVTHMYQTGDDVVGVQAGIPIPVFNKNQGNIMRANAELIAAANDLRRIELDLQDRLAVAFRRYANARQQTDRYHTEILPRAQQSLDLIARGYEQGQISFLVLLTSQRTYIRVNLAYVGALAELHQSTAAIDGQLLNDSLRSP
jgi:cobalt-zinc-cadmium efflux system outer membrane protein